MHKRSKLTELLEFSIAFYERLVEDHPDFVDALMALGEAYTRLGWYEKGLAVDQKLITLKGDDPMVWYNLACSYSLLNRPEEAFGALRRAIGLGYDDFDYLLKDPDLAPLRQSPELRRLIKERISEQPS